MTKFIAQPLIFILYALATFALAIMVFVGFGLTWLYKWRGWPDSNPKRANCWAVAVPLWLRDPVNTALVMTVSRHTRFVPHVRYAPTLRGVEYTEYVPINPKKGVEAVGDSIWFRGKLRVRPAREEKLT